ncbi:MAG TPA: hypothetical protein VGF48_14635 [Thermoanaerobaculia bacterium]
MVRYKVRIFFVAVCLLAVSGGNALARTPDGKTPSQETICDNEQGAAYGLCNAYCEAMDCDDPNQRASDQGCAAVKANYERKTGRPFLPCEVGCPCIDQLQVFQQIVAGAPVDRCIADSSSIYVVLESGEFAVISDAAPAFCSANNEPPFITLTPNETLACRVTLRRILEASGVVCRSPE